LGRLSRYPFREIKRRLETAGFAESSQKGSHVESVRDIGGAVDNMIVPPRNMKCRLTRNARFLDLACDQYAT
jgi:predicted RNA binding protein YcfA (HicA-like mRNA interferase family)